MNALLAEIESFLDTTKMGPTYFGKVAVGNSELVPRLRAGRDVETSTAERVRTFMNNNKPPTVPSAQ